MLNILIKIILHSLTWPTLKLNNLVSDSDYDVVIILGVCLSNSGDFSLKHACVNMCKSHFS